MGVREAPARPAEFGPSRGPEGRQGGSRNLRGEPGLKVVEAMTEPKVGEELLVSVLESERRSVPAQRALS